MSVIGSNVLAGASGGAGAGSYEIERSLRFNSADSAYLNRTPSSAGNRKTWTWSAWVKKSTIDEEGNLFSVGASSTEAKFRFNADNTLQVSDGSGGQLITTGVFRDTSAWYHFVVVLDNTQVTAADRFKLYVNGVEATVTGSYSTQNTDGDFNQAINHYIGRQVHNTSNLFNGYLADIHFIDGQALAATDFGETDDNGVWQPKKFAGTYGTNGFHLDFKDNSSSAALGNDAAGSNNWTVNNLTAVSNNWPNYVYAGGATYSSTETGKNFYTGNGADLFDGTTSNYVGGANVVGGTVYFRPAAAITGVTSIQLYGAYNGETRINGSVVTVSPAWGTSDQYVTIQSPPSSITEISVKGDLAYSAAARIKAIKVNGAMLVDLGPAHVDSLVDSPTNGTQTDTGAGGEVVGNYATLNPITPIGSNCTFSNGNLDVVVGGTSANGNRGIRGVSNIGMSSGKWYCEHVITGGATARSNIGVVNNLEYGADDGSGNYWIGSGANDYIVWSHTGNAYVGSGSSNSYGVSWGVGDVIGCAFNADEGKMYIYKNGTVMNSGNPSHTGLTNGPYFFIFTEVGSNISVNFGQRAFSNSNVPSGYKSLNTANLPEPTIADGSKYFDTKLFTGSGAARSITMDNSQMSPDFVWLKARNDGADHHHLFDTVRGAGKRIFSNLTNAESTDNNTLSAFGSNGFSLGTQTAVNGNGDSMVAWAWDAEANSDKTYAITVANPGSGNKYYADGALQPTLTLAEGSTYKFDQSASTNSGHPLRFSTTSDGTHGGGSEYTTGVTTAGTPGSAGAFTQIVIAASAPTLYAYCTNHSGMGFQVNTSDTGGYTIPVGSLNSSAYNFADWESMVTGTYSTEYGWGTTYQTANAFDGNLATMVIADVSQGWTFTPSSSIAGSTIEIYGWNDGCPNDGLVINGNNYGDALGADQTSGQWYTLPYSTLNSIAIVNAGSAGSSHFRLIAIRIDGKMLIQTGTSVTNVPSISSVVKAAPEAGFSIVSYTGNGASNATLGHGLGAEPYFYIVKRRDVADQWRVYHQALGATKFLNITSDGAFTASTIWNNTEPTNSVFSIGSSTSVIASGGTYIAYCFAPVEGYSAMGSYQGNGNASGPFVYTGFKIAWLMVKSSSNSGEHWLILDTARDLYNDADATIYANLNNAEAEASALGIDLLSNGFKPRGTNAGTNASGYTYVYLAFASKPFASNGGLAR